MREGECACKGGGRGEIGTCKGGGRGEIGACNGGGRGEIGTCKGGGRGEIGVCLCMHDKLKIEYNFGQFKTTTKHAKFFAF